MFISFDLVIPLLGIYAKEENKDSNSMQKHLLGLFIIKCDFCGH